VALVAFDHLALKAFLDSEVQLDEPFPQHVIDNSSSRYVELKLV
jgi:hypothetical protein